MAIKDKFLKKNKNQLDKKGKKYGFSLSRYWVFSACRLFSGSGFLLLFCPGFWVYSFSGAPMLEKPLLLMFMGSIWARSIGCLYNDWIDRDLDGQVHRTRNRPFARMMRLKRCHFNFNHNDHLFDLLFLSFIVMVPAVYFLITLPARCIYIGLLAALGVALYPFMKRWVDCPQLLLALIFNSGIWMAHGLCPGRLPVSSLVFLYISGCIWTLMYDTIYAYQDYRDDEKAGIRSYALILGYHAQGTLLLLLLFHQILFLVATLGTIKSTLWWEKIKPISGLGLVFLIEAIHVFHIDLKQPKSCYLYFRSAPLYGILKGIILWCIFGRALW